MIAVVTAILNALGFLAKEGLTFARWCVAQGRLIIVGLTVAFNWWNTLARNNIIAKVITWGLWVAAIEAAMVGLSRIVVTPIVDGAISKIIPSSGSGLLSLIWERGLNLRSAMQYGLAYLGLWGILEMNLRYALRVGMLYKNGFASPKVFR